MNNNTPMTGKLTGKQSRWFRLNLWLHRWTSLFACLPFLLMCLTGTVLIFHEEIDLAMGVLPPAPGLVDEAQPFNTAINNALAAYPDEKVSVMGIDSRDHPGLLLIGTVPLGDRGFERMTSRYAYLDTGQLTLEKGTQRETLTSILFELHAQWFLGPAGALVGALIALLVMLSVLSGMVVYGPYVRRVAFGTFRRGQRLFQLDLHNFVGVIVMGWLLLVLLTGFFLGIGTIVTGAWAQRQLVEGQESYYQAEIDVRNPPVTADEVFMAAQSVAPPEWTVELIIWPGTNLTSNQNYAVRIIGSGLDKRLFRVVLVDAVTGAVTKTVELPWYMKTIVLSQPLHFGNYGGLPVKLLWTVCIWLTMYITGNGVWLWWKRSGSRNSNRRGEAA